MCVDSWELTGKQVRKMKGGYEILGISCVILKWGSAVCL